MKNKSNNYDNETAGKPEASKCNALVSNSQRNDLFREMNIVWLAINLIDAAPRRVRRAAKTQIENVIQAIRSYGFRFPILVKRISQSGTYEVIDGHIRLEAARQLDALEVPCIVVDDLSDVDVRRLRLSLNKLQETGQWDDDVLRLEIAELIEITGDYEIPGFEVPEIDLMLQGISFETSGSNLHDALDDLPEEGTDQVSLPGDFWIAQRHCVVSARGQDLGKIVSDGALGTAAMVITDPPYNLKVNGHVSTVSGRHAEFAQGSGEMSSDEFTCFLINTLGPAMARLRPGGIAYVFMDWRHQPEILSALHALDLELINLAVWVKPAPGMETLYRSRHELVFVVRKPGAPHRNNVQLGRFGRNRTNVWEYGGATSGNTEEDDFSVHPTVKPVAMIRDAILDVSAPDDLIIDCFLGSGSTLIAAETSHRRCLGIEVEPAYVDLALRRWMDLTGQDAVLAITGETFQQVAQRRSVKLLTAPYGDDSDE